MRGSRKFFQRGSNFFLINEWIQIPLKSGHHRPASEKPLKWRFAGVPMMVNIECWLGSFVIFQEIRTSIAQKLYIFVIFRGGGGGSGPPVSPLDPHMLTTVLFILVQLRITLNQWQCHCKNRREVMPPS